jgi:DNA-binding CsgD family transcriptional regulator
MTDRRRIDACRGEACVLAVLTTTQYRALGLVAAGWSNERIGGRLGMARRQVAVVLRGARESAGVPSERALIAWYWYCLALGTAQRTERATTPSAQTRLRRVS